MKTIVLITNSFPFGIVEKSFIAPEFALLSKRYNFIIIARNIKEEQTTGCPDNVTIYRYDSKKGYNTAVLLARALMDTELFAELKYLASSGKVNKKNILKAITVMMRTLHFSDFLKKIRATVKDEQIIYYTYWNDYATYACARIKNKDKVVSRIHRADLYLLKDNNFYLAYKNLTNDKADRLFFISKEGLEYYKSTFKDYTDKLRLNYLGVKKQERLSPYGIHKSLKLLSFSYLSPVKRVDRIIDTLSGIDDIEIEWTHIGGGVLESELKEKADKQLASKQNITYKLTGYMHNEDAVRYVGSNEFDFLLNVSYSEGLPVTMMEAMSLGIPVIATNVGGVNEIVCDGENGYLIARDFENGALAEKLREYYNMSAEDKLCLRKNALKTWESKFFDENNYRKYAEELEIL